MRVVFCPHSFDMNGVGRLVRMAVALSERGIPACVLIDPSVEALSRFDAIVLQRPFTAPWVSKIARLRGKVRIILDIEDHFIAAPPYNQGYHLIRSGRAIDNFEFAARAADAVTVITPAMRDYYRRYNRNIHHVPHGIDMAEFPRPSFERPPREEVRIGWTGTSARRHDLATLAGVLPRLMRDFPQARLYHTGHLPFPLNGATAIRDDGRRDWYEQLADLRLDIGINPYNDNEFNQCCFPTKVLEFSALGIPSVTSHLGNHHELVRHGETGFLARTEQDWYSGLAELIAKPELRESMGKAAYEHVKANYRLEISGQPLERILRGLTADDESAKTSEAVVCGDAKWARRLLALWPALAAALAWPPFLLLHALGMPGAQFSALAAGGISSYFLLRDALLRHRDAHADEALLLGHTATPAPSRWNPLTWATAGAAVTISLLAPARRINGEMALIRMRGAMANREAGFDIPASIRKLLAGITALLLLLSCPIVPNSTALEACLAAATWAAVGISAFIAAQWCASKLTAGEIAAPRGDDNWPLETLRIWHEYLCRAHPIEEASRSGTSRVERLQETLIGCFEYFAKPSMRIGFGGPLNGYSLRTAMFESLFTLLRPQAIFEAGAFRGTTTEYFGGFGVPVYACELSIRSYAYSRVRLMRKSNITLYRSDSRDFLRRCAEKNLCLSEAAFFYLDAHAAHDPNLFHIGVAASEDLPLAEELKIIFGNWKNAVVLIDDFKVPGDPGYRFEDYGPGKALDHSYLDRCLDDSVARFIPVPSSKEESGSRFGYALLTASGDIARRLESGLNAYVWRFDGKTFAQEIDPRVARNSIVGIPRLLRLKRLLLGLTGISGSVAEVGVYRGGTALLLAQNAPERKTFLFDTFTGMPETIAGLDLVRKGDFGDTSLDHVRDLLKGMDNVSIHQGPFPAHNAEAVAAETFALVHLDCDIYKSVKECLEFFYPRMIPGGVIVLDDYNERDCPGAKLAADGFAKFVGEKVVATVETQAIIVKKKTSA